MNPKERAIEFLLIFHIYPCSRLIGKQFATECVDKIIQELNDVDLQTEAFLGFMKRHSYWEEVKQEIQKL